MKVPTTLLLVFVSLLAKASTAGDIYWEGDDDLGNEFLEVDPDTSIIGHLKRLKRQFFDDVTPEPETEDNVTEDEENAFDDDLADNDFNGGSGAPVSETETDLKEKTLRVTFVVEEPYQQEYSNRDSVEFQNFSKTLAESVNLVFRDLSGTHRASLVRIQSRIGDVFSCKVTLDIVTTGVDTNQVAETLRDYIRTRRSLGNITVSDDYFSANVVDSGFYDPLDMCRVEEIACNDGRCLPETARCNGIEECSDGADEQDCPNDNETVNLNEEQDETQRGDLPYDTTALPDLTNPESENPEDRNAETETPYKESPEVDNQGNPNGENREAENTDRETNPEEPNPEESNPDEPNPDEPNPEEPKLDEQNPDVENTYGNTTDVQACPPGAFRCDETRCLYASQRCDQMPDCEDGTDEVDCPEESCGADDYTCNNGKCIENSRRCDRVQDCADGEDEQACECRPDEFSCLDDGSCIEDRKRCDGLNHCRDGSDEINCACSSDQWQCDRGNCIKRSKRCNGRVDCPNDRSDERNCIANGFFKCRTGKLIPEYERCNRRYDCDHGDYSDEQNCPCGEGDFKCDNDYCIPASKKCDRTHDCQDGSDERNCTYGSFCMAYQYKCTSGECVAADARCNGTQECMDGSDETNCPCKRGQFKCHDGSCINFSKRCDGHADCPSYGDDEINCASPRCGPESFTCDPGSRVTCATRCDGRQECDTGEDEDGCSDCSHMCDDKCLEDSQICDQIADCSDGSDEINCPDCDEPNDFRCQNGECINAAQRCNGVPECEDSSDELYCNITVTPEPTGCNYNQFQCRDGSCIDNQFFCDKHDDCNDKSDEENCPCDEGYWQCLTGQCIPSNGYCDGIPDCLDESDERDCPVTSRPSFTTSTVYPVYPTPPPTTQSPIYTTTSSPYYDRGCGRNEWRCENGPCIDVSQRCNGQVDCPRDGSDEFDCPTGTPAALELQTYPEEQTVRTGGDVVFSCRDKGSNRATVRWVREGGKPFKANTTDRNGRLEMTRVTPADSGIYICQAVRYLGYPGSELRVVLNVEKSSTVYRPPHTDCQENQATCANGQCIPRSAICDGKIDCFDRSDEDSCHNNNMQCEPNQFRCANRKCVLKTWICDGEDDCGDRSDEQSCGPPIPGQQCLPVEFACLSNDQCIPKTFHCDGQSDCYDKSDEICVPVNIAKQPTPSNVKLGPGETLTLVCEAVGVPTPLISWRLNWGNVPEKCTATNVNGVGTLTCPDMQLEDSGAYSCEAINNRASSFAARDAIVHVDRTEVLCADGFFNSLAQYESECISCFCFGKSTQCKSADLFIFNMPTLLGEGGTRLVGFSLADGGIQKDQQISNRYYYVPLRNGATVTKLADYGSAMPRNSAVHPYITLPESYNGNQLTSYGGSIKYILSPHNPQRLSRSDDIPDIIILGKYESLIYNRRPDDQRVEARLVPGKWRKPTSRGLIPATREDIMMALDAVETILLRADFNNAGVNITDFTMESAQLLNIGLGAASLVEECTCPPGYKGRSCEKCANGYELQSTGPWLGVCVPKAPCPPMTYGDPNSGLDCRPCPCPLTNRDNQFASGCSIGPGGNVVCHCLPGYEGPDCSYCAPDYFGNPLNIGDSCRLKPQDDCDPSGTAQVRLRNECVCKDNVQGRYCDQCKNGSFYLSKDNRNGCALCFCTGVSNQCVSSTLRRRTNTVRFNVPEIVDQLKVYRSAQVGPSSTRYVTPIETDLHPALVRGEMTLNIVPLSEPSTFYWALQDSFAGDKVTSYGGSLTYQLRNVQTNPSLRNTAADIQLVSENSLTFLYYGDVGPTSDGFLNVSVQLIENGWQRSDGKPVTREHFLLALADVKSILIKATYSTNTDLASIESASITTADEYGDGPVAQNVEQCVCPVGYKGTSCEDCASGYTRSSSGLYLEHCDLCECNGHSNMCHPETGECFECNDNTDGPSCEDCRVGYERDANNYCVPKRQPQPQPGFQCNCDPRGEEIPCRSLGYCSCKRNVEGENCDRCRPSTFGLDASNPLGCTACYCSGVTSDCHEAIHYSRVLLPVPIFGENYGGYTLMDINAERVINDQFVPVVNESELMYVFSDDLRSINYESTSDLYWSLPVIPGNRVLSYGGTLSLTQKFKGDYDDVSYPGTDVVLIGESLSIFWSNLTPIRSNVAVSYQVPLKENGWYILNTPTHATRQDFMSVLKNLKRVLVRATLVSENLLSTSIADVSMETAVVSYDPTLRAARGIEECTCPEGYIGTSCESCSVGYYKDRSGQCRQCNCNGHDCQLGNYEEVICNCRPPYIGPDCSTVGGDSTVEVTTRPPPGQSTVVVKISLPTIKIAEIGSTVNFTCQASSRMVPNRLPVNWYKADGYLPQGRSYVDTSSGLLYITNLQVSDSGKYICQTSDGISTEQAFATLKVPGNDMTPPTVSISPSVKEYLEGSRIELTCTTTGNPAPRITWQRSSNRALPRSSETYDALLIIDNASVEDSGEYRCIATNAAGSTDRVAVVTVRPREREREKLKVSTTSPTLNEGQSTRIVCTGTSNMPAGTIDWIRQDRTEFLDNVRSDNGVLYVDVARYDNRGVYICQTKSNDVNPVLIVLTIIPSSTLPPEETTNITLSVSSLRIPTGGTGTVECIPQGYPVPLIKWTKHDDTFGPGTSQRENTLIISNAQESDRGYYVCEGNVDQRSIVRNYVYVDIEKREKAKVEIYPKVENFATLGSEYQLQCYVSGGNPLPVVTWDRNGGRPLSPNVQILQNNVLRFQNIEVNDEGEYTCTATNEAGSASATAILKVRSTPVIRILPDNYIQANRGDRVSVECRADGYPEPEVSIKSSSGMRLIVPPRPRMATLNIPRLSDSDDGVYICTATSAAGTVEDQFAIRVERGDVEEREQDGIPPSDKLVLEDKETRIICNASDEFIVIWGRADRQPLQPNARQVGNELVISDTSKSDTGRYECMILNRRTNDVQQSAYTSLQVIAAPKITLRPPRQTVHPGQSPTVECHVEGDDILSISWRPLNRIPSSRVEYRGSTLLFRQIEVEDAGEYECFAMNSMANVTAIAEVIVSEDTNRATSESNENEQFAHVGAAVHLSCNVSQTNVRIRWTKDGRSVPRSISQKSDGSLFIRLAQKSDSGHYICLIRDPYGRQTTNYINLHIEGPRDVSAALVAIDQPRRTFKVGEKVEILCRANSRDVKVKWERYGTNQYVESRTYGDGALLLISEVQEPDVGVYRCTGTDQYGIASFDDFNLEVVPGQNEPVYPVNDRDTTFTARLGSIVDLPCDHNLEEPASFEWRREYSSLPPGIRRNDRNLHFDGVTEADAGTYVCRVTNNRASVDARATLRVVGLVPKFNGDGWVALPTLSDAHMQFDIEISFKPSDPNGIILYNSQNKDGTGHYLILQLIDGVPEFTLKVDTASPLVVGGDRPLQLNVWHTIRLHKSGSRVAMDVDNVGPFMAEFPNEYAGILDLYAPLYIGGAPDQRPPELAHANGFVGCVSMLILGREEKNIMVVQEDVHNILECDSCSLNQCLNGGVCQEARNERGYICLCSAGYVGMNCDRTGDACRPGICGPGKCTDTAAGYKCACPVTFTGKNCDVKQNIDYPAFTGSAYLAIKPPNTSRFLRMSMKIKPKPPVTDGIIMYCAQSPRGYGGFTSLAVHDGRLEFRYDVGDGNDPIVLISNRTLKANDWTDVRIARVGVEVSLKIDMIYNYEATLASAKDLNLETPMFVGGVDDSIVLNNNTGVTGGFSGCIKDVTLHGDLLNLINASIQSANVQECVNDRGDIPEIESICSQCRNDGYCASADATSCICQPGFTGTYCESRVSFRSRSGTADPCSTQPCYHGGTCRVDRSTRLNYSCDCPLGYTGPNCQMQLDLLQSVGFNGNGYLELPASFLRYDKLSTEPALIALAFHTNQDGVLLYQKEAQLAYGGDFILFRVENGIVVLEWDLGGGNNTLTIPEVIVTDGERHNIVALLYEDNHIELTVDTESRSAMSNGISNVMNADSNIYIGGIRDYANSEFNYVGLVGCIEQVEFNNHRSVNLGNVAVTARNTQQCKE